MELGRNKIETKVQSEDNLTVFEGRDLSDYRLTRDRIRPPSRFLEANIVSLTFVAALEVDYMNQRLILRLNLQTKCKMDYSYRVGAAIFIIK